MYWFLFAPIALVRMKDFIMEGERRNWKIKLYNFPNTTSYRDVFWEIKQSTKLRGKVATLQEHHIVLDVPRKHLYKVLKAVSTENRYCFLKGNTFLLHFPRIDIFYQFLQLMILKYFLKIRHFILCVFNIDSKR